MSKNLVIVESPAKAKTIAKFLGPDFTVMSSQGHIRDLRKHDLSIDVESGAYTPVYEVPAEKKRLVTDLKKATKAADKVWLASDEDREGEAIAWHLAEVLGLDPATTARIVFHEITKPAILNALEHPRTIDLNRVDAQQARRVLDRIVGFELSPVLWRKVKGGLSAGRVQSVAVRLICEREAEIKGFTPEPFWRVNAVFTLDGGHQVKAELSKKFTTEAEAREFLDSLKDATYKVTDIKVSPVKRSPLPPFTTSTLQQEAARKLGMPVAATMRVAQSLYEAGHITYMRTDSLNLSGQAVGAIKKGVEEKLGKEYVHVRQWHTKSKGAQEAHEAIRPTYIDRERIAGLEPREQSLYSLIWRRAVASQMADAQLERTVAEIQPSTRPESFRAEGEVVKFDGFMRVYMTGTLDAEPDDESTDNSTGGRLLPTMKVGEALTADNVTATERFTQAPPRYTEAMLVRKLEELGIGRPSTYAPTISTIQQREYVAKGEKAGMPRTYEVLTLKDGKVTDVQCSENYGAERGKLIPTDTGIIVNDYLTAQFPDILDYDFTARMEEQFDKVAEGGTRWEDDINTFYHKFHPEVERAEADKGGPKPGERHLGEDPKTGKPVSVKIGRYGAMAQIGEASDEEKPRFASLRPDQSVFDITLEEALKLFDLPRTLGEHPDDGKEVKAAVGRFGPYVSHAGMFASIPKGLSPTSITLDEAVELLRAKQEAEAKKLIKAFDEEPDLQILNGRYGVYISYKKANYKIPQTVDHPEELTLDQVKEIIANQPAPKARRGRTKK